MIPNYFNDPLTFIEPPAGHSLCEISQNGLAKILCRHGS